MIIIAHRGLINGPDLFKENEPGHISHLLQSDWHVETDVWWQDNAWWLGHDHAAYLINFDFLLQPNLWIHAKNTAASDMLMKIYSQHTHLNFFWHESDERVLTSQSYWWTQPGCDLTHNCIAVLPEIHVHDVTQCLGWACAGVCTDWGAKLK